MSHNPLPRQLYSQQQAKALDATAIAAGTPGEVLMQRAGMAAFELLRQQWPSARRLAIFCGGGNNGGDGYVVARLALDAGFTVFLYQAAPLEKLTDTARTKAQEVLGDAALQPLDPSVMPSVDVIVDSLLGIGIKGAPREAMAALIQQINAQSSPVFSLDLPSGLNGDSGWAAGEVIHADVTLTFIAVKKGLLTGRGKALTGQLHYHALGVPDAVFATQTAEAEQVTAEDVVRQLPPRPRDAHKGHFGHLLIVGGDYGFGGAVIMAAQAALRSGAGLVSVATQPEHVPAILARQPEIMAHGITAADDLLPLLDVASVIAVGPGLGKSPWGKAMLAAVIGSHLTDHKPQLLDADALNLLAMGNRPVTRTGRVLTPHPGEAARLLGCSTADIAADRFDAVKRLQQRYQSTVLLKGAGTLIAGEGRPVSLVNAGNPGMASGGMGDVLSGIIGALMAQHLSTFNAARIGALVHAQAADMAAQQQGERGLAATDLCRYLPALLNGRST